MREKKIHRREFLRRLGGWLTGAAGVILTGTLIDKGGVKSPCGHPARHYRKLAG